MRIRPRGWVSLLFTLALVVAACGGGDGDGGGGGGGNGNGGDGGDGAAKVDQAECGLEEFEAAAKPVEITFWHTMARANNDWIEAATEEFNASQDEVNVKLVQQPGYQEALTKYKAGLGGGDLPDLVHLEETVVQVMLDSQSTIPMQACVDAAEYDLSDFLPRATGYYSTQDVLRAMPWTISNPILMFDRNAMEEAGLDPENPPQTLDEVREAAQKIVDSGTADYGIALRIEPYVFEFLYAKSGATYVNNGNGRDERATAADLDTDTGLEIWTWWKDMVDDGLALNTGGEPGNFDHMLAIGNGKAVMAFEASGVLGTVRAVLESGQFPGVEIAAGPLPALTTGGGVPVGDGALWIPEEAAPEKRGAAWKFVEFLSSAEQQAALAVAGGYVPTRQSAAEQPDLAETWADEPAFRVAYDQLLAGPLDAATVGSVIGDYQGVRNAVRDAMISMLAEDLAPEDALARAQADATAAIEEYNSRVGA